MRIVFFSFRSIWASFLKSWRLCRKVWGFALLFIIIGVCFGILTAVMVEEPQEQSVLGSILANTYKPFASFGLCVLCLVIGILICYVSARFTHRIPFWCYLVGVGYILGRVSAFACMMGALGIVSIVLCEIPFVLIPIAFVVGYYCALRDILFFTLAPRCNKPYCLDGIRYLVCGTLIAFAYVVVAWGIVAAFINVIV